MSLPHNAPQVCGFYSVNTDDGREYHSCRDAAMVAMGAKWVEFTQGKWCGRVWVEYHRAHVEQLVDALNGKRPHSFGGEFVAETTGSDLRERKGAKATDSFRYYSTEITDEDLVN